MRSRLRPEELGARLRMLPGLDGAELGLLLAQQDDIDVERLAQSASISRRASVTSTSGKKSRLPMMTPSVCLGHVVRPLDFPGKDTELIRVGRRDELAVDRLLLRLPVDPVGDERVRLLDGEPGDRTPPAAAPSP